MSNVAQELRPSPLQETDEEVDEDEEYEPDELPSSSPLASKGSKRTSAESGRTASTARTSQSLFHSDEDKEEEGEEDDAMSISETSAMDVSDSGPAHGLLTPPDSQSNDLEENVRPLEQGQARGKVVRRSARSRRTSSLSDIVQKTSALALDEYDEDNDDTAVIIPNKNARQAGASHAGSDAEYVHQRGQTDPGKKKKR